MLLINVGGAKGFKNFSDKVRDNWKVMDVDPKKADYLYDVNSTEPIPLNSDSVDGYYCSMILEHVDPGILPGLLKEFYRTLKPNGRIRVVVPDFRLACFHYLNDPRWLWRKDLPTGDKTFPETALGKLMPWFYSRDGVVKGAMRHGHKMCFDAETLKQFFMGAGFRGIVQRDYNTKDSMFDGKDFKRYAEWSIYLEAQK